MTKKHFLLLALLLFTFSAPLFGWTVLSPALRGWNQSPLTFQVNYANCPITQDELNSALDAALELWNNIPGSSLVLARGSSTTTVAAFMADTATDTPVILCDPQMSTNLGTDSNFIPGATMRVAGSSNITYGGILLNAEAGKSSQIANLTPLELEIVMAHEMGHVLGLGHSSIESALMYYSIGDKSELLIGEDDRDGVRFLYPANEFSGGLYGCSSVHVHAHSPPTQSVLYSVFFFLFLGLLPRLSRKLFPRLFPA